MCDWGDTVVLDFGRPADVDRCIAPLVSALNASGFPTVACCCGHGKQPGRISLADGRDLFIAPDFEVAQAISAAFPPINP